MTAAPTNPGPIHADPHDPRSCLLMLKVVPGARRDALAGLLGDRIKVRVAAPPEDGRANDAVCALVASATGIARREVELVAGHAQPLKTLRLRGVSPADARARLLPAAGPDRPA